MNHRRIFNALDDGYGQCPLQDPANRIILSQALLHFNGERYRSGDFVIMPNHVHWLIQPHPDYRLEEILHSIKRFTARRINQQMDRTGPFWQKEFYDHIVRDENELHRIRRYIADNPAKANLNVSHYASHQADWLD